jgi:phosphoribosyl 1,2-cyclic phosphate phosphodiesterase
MKFIVTGSGGCVCTPKPLCQCNVCVQARKEGYPYARCGCSLYLEDIALLIDTPEDISVALNNADIRAVDSIMYSHWDPDHTLGMRVVEQLRLEWLDYYENIKPGKPISVYAQPDVMADINEIRGKYGSLLNYYEHMNLIKRHIVEQPLDIGNIKVTLVPVAQDKAVSVFAFESNGKKLIYAPCDCLPFPEHKVLFDADVFVIGNTFIGNILKNGKIITEAHPLRKELHSFEDALRIKEKLRANRLVITHIEEDWGKSLNDYSELEHKFTDVSFAYDGMSLEL